MKEVKRKDAALCSAASKDVEDVEFLKNEHLVRRYILSDTHREEDFSDIEICCVEDLDDAVDRINEYLDAFSPEEMAALAELIRSGAEFELVEGGWLVDGKYYPEGKAPAAAGSDGKEVRRYSIKYVETYSGIYDVDAEDYPHAVNALKDAIREGKESGPRICIDSYCEPAYEDLEDVEAHAIEGKWFYANIEGLDENLQKISMPVVVCDQCNTFFPVAYAGAGHHYCPNCGKRLAPADDGVSAEAEQEQESVFVTFGGTFRYTAEVSGSDADISDKEAILDAANDVFCNADPTEFEYFDFEPLSISTADGEFIWER